MRLFKSEIISIQSQADTIVALLTVLALTKFSPASKRRNPPRNTSYGHQQPRDDCLMKILVA